MAQQPQKKIIDEILGDAFTTQVLQELEAQHLSREAQERVLALTGDAILKRVTLELLAGLLESDLDEFESLIGKGDQAALREFLAPRIPNLDRFIMNHAMKEYETMKTQVRMQEQGVGE